MRIQSSEKGDHPGDQVGQADVLGQVVIGAQAQTRNGVQLAVQGREENDRQIGCAGAQLAAEVETALGLVPQAHVDNDQVRQPGLKRRQRLWPVGVGADPVSLASESLGVILTQGGLVLDDGNGAFHGESKHSMQIIAGGQESAIVINLP